MMKKFVSGLLIGFLLAIPTYAIAEQTSMIGKTIESEYPVIIDGKELEVPAIVVDGRSFAPVRAIGEAVGLDVSFENQTITLTSSNPQGLQGQQAKEGEIMTESPQTTQEKPEFGYTLENIDRGIASVESSINGIKAMIQMEMNKPGGPIPEILQRMNQRLAEEEDLLERLKTYKQKLLQEAQGTP